jgi:hypothetical protein
MSAGSKARALMTKAIAAMTTAIALMAQHGAGGAQAIAGNRVMTVAPRFGRRLIMLGGSYEY